MTVLSINGENLKRDGTDEGAIKKNPEEDAQLILDRAAGQIPLAKDSNRLKSLDIFRGLTVAFMILVNNPGSWDEIYPPFEHAHWNGCTPTDLVFPFFLYIVGVSTSFSLTRAKENAKTSNKIMLKILRRGITLFGIGLFLNLFPRFQFENVRIMGVLQRIALVYMASAFLFLYLNKKQLIYTGVFLLIGYYLLMVTVPLLVAGTFSLEPGKSVAALIDRAIISNQHMWREAKTWDPEGLTSTIPAIASSIIGILTGMLLRDQLISGLEKVIKLFISAFFIITAGLIWSLFFPINKSLWTSSYVLFSGGIAMSFLTVMYYLIDIRKNYKGLTFFLVFGMNSIAVFVLSGLIPRIMNLLPVSKDEDGKPVMLQQSMFETVSKVSSPKNASLLYALLNVAFYFTILSIMYRKKIFIKI